MTAYNGPNNDYTDNAYGSVKRFAVPCKDSTSQIATLESLEEQKKESSSEKKSLIEKKPDDLT